MVVPSRIPHADAVDYGLLVASVSDYAIFMLDQQGIVVSWNPGAERLKGYRAEEVVGSHFGLFYPEAERASSKPLLALRTAESEGRFEDEGWRLRKDGSRFWANVVLTPIFGADGELRGFAKVTRDLTLRREAELALREERLGLETILECVGDAVTVCDSRGQITFANRASRAAQEDAVASSVRSALAQGSYFASDGVSPMVPEGSPLLRALEGKWSDHVPYVRRTAAHPEPTTFSISARPLVGADGQIVGAVSVARDVTEWQRLNDDLAAQRTLLRSVLDSVAESIAVFDPRGRLVLSNPTFISRLHERPATDEPVRHDDLPIEVFAPDGSRELPREEWPAQRALRGESVEDLELLVRQPDGQSTLVSTNARLLRDARGEVSGVVVTGRDVTARRAYEAKLIEKENLLTAILNCLGEGVLVYDREGRILLHNPAAKRLISPTLNEDRTFEERKTGYTAVHPDGTPVPPPQWPGARALRGESCDNVELLLRDAVDGHSWALSTNGRPLHDGSGTFLGAVLTFRDISQRMSAERERESLLQELNRSNAELAQFAYAASHDLRAPLRAVTQLSQWIEEALRPHFDEETRHLMTLLQNRLGRMEALLRDLLQFAQVNQTKSAVVPIDLGALLAEVVELAGIPSGFRLTTDVAVPTLQATRVPLRQALLNLVVNAIKHHDRDEGEVLIHVRPSAGAVTFEVIDDGPGIPAEFQRRVFEMFTTLKSRDQVEGSGMGLAYVKKAAERAGGSISVRSEGRGATFQLTWPNAGATTR